MDRQVGLIHISEMENIRMVSGDLNIGEPIATTIIKEVKSEIDSELLNIIDAPPGTSCPVIETLQKSDFIILVTEPTPFGLHDLEIAVNVVRQLGIPHGVIINKDGIGDNGVQKFCMKNEILGIRQSQQSVDNRLAV